MPPSVFRWGIPKHGNTETHTHRRGPKHGNTETQGWYLAWKHMKHTKRMCFWILSGYVWTWTTYLDIWISATHSHAQPHAATHSHTQPCTCALTAHGSLCAPLCAYCARARLLTQPQLSARALATLALRCHQPAARRPPPSPLLASRWRWPFSRRAPSS